MTPLSRRTFIPHMISHFPLKTLLSIFFCLVASLPCPAQMWPQPFQLKPYEREIRAVWYCTLGGIDWPGHQYAQTEHKASLQRQRLCEDFDRLKAAGINVILFQARVRGTVTYASE